MSSTLSGVSTTVTAIGSSDLIYVDVGPGADGKMTGAGLKAHLAATLLPAVAVSALPGSPAAGSRATVNNSSVSAAGNFGAIVAAAPSFTTLDPVSAVAALSGGDLVATVAAGARGSYLGARSVAGVSTGKYFWEISTTTVGDNATEVAIANTGADLGAGSGVYLGEDANSLGAFDNGPTYIGGSSVATVASMSGSVVVGVAVDAGAKLLWVRVGAGNWNNNASADPTTGAFGIDISGITGPYHAAWASSCNSGARSATFNFGASTFAHSAPSGYGALPASPGYTVPVFYDGSDWRIG